MISISGDKGGLGCGIGCNGYMFFAFNMQHQMKCAAVTGFGSDDYRVMRRYF